jgi:hypothetical protein
VSALVGLVQEVESVIGVDATRPVHDVEEYWSSVAVPAHCCVPLQLHVHSNGGELTSPKYGCGEPKLFAHVLCVGATISQPAGAATQVCVAGMHPPHTPFASHVSTAPALHVEGSPHGRVSPVLHSGVGASIGASIGASNGASIDASGDASTVVAASVGLVASGGAFASIGVGPPSIGARPSALASLEAKSPPPHAVSAASAASARKTDDRPGSARMCGSSDTDEPLTEGTIERNLPVAHTRAERKGGRT